jgi:REP element-mobilizing transposase RayT
MERDFIQRQDHSPGARRLRAGRWSAVGQIYLITTVTCHRFPLFDDFYRARVLVDIMREDQARGSHQTLAFVVMPDHLHWLLELKQGTLSALVGRVKSLAGKRIGRPLWQDGFHDRALRQEEDVLAVARYIVANPVRAGLVRGVGQYPHWDAVWL